MEELAEKYRINIEDNVRLLYQRIRVAEQIHNENKEGCKKMKEWYETEIRDLIKEKLATYVDPARKMKEISETAKKHIPWTGRGGKADEIKRLKHTVDCLVTQLNEKEEQEGVLGDKVCELEASASKEAEEKLNMTKGSSQLEEQVGNLERELKDMDEDLLILGEEMREPIRSSVS